jgi:hypothetical protein
MRLYYYTAKQWGIKSLWEKRLKVAEYKDLNDPFELLPFERKKKGDREQWDHVLKLLRQFGVLCFSESWQTTLMWAHYTDKHSGMVLGFDIHPPDVTKIKYVPKRYKSPVTSDADWSDGWINGQILTDAVDTKFDGWAYEREWRMRVSLADPVDGIHYRPFDYGHLKLKEVIIGARCSLSSSDVADAIGTQWMFDVEVKKARDSFGEFEICRQERVPILVVPGLLEGRGSSESKFEADIRTYTPSKI